MVERGTLRAYQQERVFYGECFLGKAPELSEEFEIKDIIQFRPFTTPSRGGT